MTPRKRPGRVHGPARVRVRKVPVATTFSTSDLKFRCTGCGWEFTIHEVPNTSIYARCLWACPNCGDCDHNEPIDDPCIGLPW